MTAGGCDVMKSSIDKLADERCLPGFEDEVSVLLDQNAQQELADGAPKDEMGYRKHTASTLLVRRPAAYTLIAKMAAEGVGVRGISRILNVGEHTVGAVLVREAGSVTVSKWKADFSKLMRGTSMLAMARANELLADDNAVKEAGIRGLGSFLQQCANVMEKLEGAEKNVEMASDDEVDDADYASEYERQLEAEVRAGPQPPGLS